VHRPDIHGSSPSQPLQIVGSPQRLAAPQKAQHRGITANSSARPERQANRQAGSSNRRSSMRPLSLSRCRPKACKFARFRRKACYRFASRNRRHAMNATTDIQRLRHRDVRQRLDRAASCFDAADFVHGVTRDGLLERLRPMTVDAAVVVDLGAATGTAVPLLRRRFRRARVIAVDSSAAMLHAARGKRGLVSKQREVQADAGSLPFANGSVDVFFCNLMLPWLDRPDAVFAEVARVLRRDGLFAFATLGPDSLVEIREAWRSVDGGEHVRQFPDMHDVGDALVRAGLRDPVLDVDRLTVNYASSEALFRDLTAAGARNCLRQRQAGLMGRGRFRRFIDALFTEGTGCSITFELVYGHCWGDEVRRTGAEIALDAGKIPVRRQ
jgi:malonyl-CoA O-methyltransferase